MNAASKVRGVSLMAVLFANLACGGMPGGYEVGDEPLSPDGRYALLYPRREEVGEKETPNLLVQLEPFRILDRISPGVPQGATMKVTTEWNGSGLVAVAQFRRWGLAGLWVYELDDGQVTRRHPVLEEARKIFHRDLQERLLKKFPDEAGTMIFVSDEGEENPVPEFAFRGRKLDLNLFADNKPNGAPGPHWTARLRAVWDCERGRFEQIRFLPGEIEIRDP